MQIFEMFDAIEAEFGKKTAILCIAVYCIGCETYESIYNLVDLDILWFDAAKEHLHDQEDDDILYAIKIVKACEMYFRLEKAKSLKELIETI